MRLRRMLAFVLSLAMILGNVTPAYAADSSGVPNISGNVQITQDEDGNIVLTGNTDETPEVVDEDGGDETPENPDGGDETPENPDGGDETPENPDGGDETPENPDGGDETPENPDGGDETPENPDGGDETPENPDGGDETPENPDGGDETPENPDGEEDDEAEQPSTEEEDSEEGDESLEEKVQETISDNEVTVSQNDVNQVYLESKENIENETVSVWTEEQSSELFVSLQDAKNYICGRIDSGLTEGEYRIELLDDITANPGELDYNNEAFNGKIILDMKGHTLTVNQDQHIRVDVLDGASRTDDGEYIEGNDGTISIANGKTLYFVQPDAGTGSWVNNVSIRNASNAKANLVVGNMNSEGSLFFDNADINITNLETCGQVRWNSGIVKATNLTVKNIQDNERQIYQQAEFNTYVQVVNFYLNEGNSYVLDLEVTGKLQAATGRSLGLGAHVDFDGNYYGNSEVNDIEIITGQNDWAFHISLEQDVTLREDLQDETNGYWDDYFAGGNADIDFIFRDAKIEDNRAQLTINGKVTKEAGTANQIVLHKSYRWKLPDGDGWTRTCEVSFDENEMLAKVNSNVSPAMFYVNLEGKCVVKDDEDNLHLADALVMVWVQGMNVGYDYPSLEEATAGIENDFGVDGEYGIEIKGDITLTEDITIPDCVKGLDLSTDGVILENDQCGDAGCDYWHPYQRCINLNGHTLNAEARINMGSGVRLVNHSDKESTLNVGGAQYEALNIDIGKYVVRKDEDGNNILALACDEYGNTIYDEQGKPIDGRGPVLENITVNANGKVRLWGNQYQDFCDTSITADELEIAHGTWVCKEVKVTNLQVNRENDEWDQEGNLVNADRACLEAESITINSGGHMNVSGRIGSWDQNRERGYTEENPWNGNNPVLTLNGAKLHMEHGAECYLKELKVTEAYAYENVSDYTVENHGQFFVNTLDTSVCTFLNEGNMLANKVTVKDFHNEGNGSLICNTFRQEAGSKTYLAGNSRMMVNDDGTLNNVNLGSKNGGDGDAALGRSKEGTLKINGTFTANEENQKLNIAVTDTYKEIEKLTDRKTYFNPYPINEAGEYDAGVILYYLTEGELFTTDHTEFPVEHISVHPVFDYGQAEGDTTGEIQRDEQGNLKGNPYSSAKQDGDKILITGEIIELHSITADGYNWSWIKNFTSWKDAITHLTAIGNADTDYVLFLKDDIEVGGTLVLPANVASLEICGDGKDGVTLGFTGDINLAADTIFSSVTLDNPEAVINTNGKKLIFGNASGVFENITGTATTTVTMYFSDITLTLSDSELNAVSGIGKMEVYGSQLTVKKALTGIGQIELKDWYWGNEETGEWKKACLDAEGDITVSTLLLKKQDIPSVVTSGGKITITDIIVFGEGNTLEYEDLEIKGNLKSFSERYNEKEKYVEEYEDISEVYAVEREKVTTLAEGTEAHNIYYEISDTEPEAVEGVKPNYVKVKRNAINLICNKDGAITTDTVLATAPKITPSWFVYGRSKIAEEEIENVTRKEKAEIKYGTKALEEENVILNVWLKDFIETEEGTMPLWGKIQSFSSLQEAFDEIEFINDSTLEYQIVLNENVGEATVDFQFPAKASWITIQGAYGEEEEGKVITFKTKADLKCNVKFENVELNPTEKAKAAMNLGNFAVVFAKSELPDTMTITGSGIGKGSEVIVVGEENENGELTVGTINNVDILSVVSSDLYVAKATKVGKLWMNDGSTLCGKGAIALTDVECQGIGTIVTFPTKVAGDEDEDGFVTSEITAMNSTLTISGVVDLAYEDYEIVAEEGELDYIVEEGELNIKLGYSTGTEVTEYEVYYPDAFSDKLMSSNKAILAKAPKVSTKGISFNEIPEGVYKNAGNIIYKEAEQTVELSYHTGSYDEYDKPIYEVTYCENFAAAVAEINNMKTKRDYTIRFLEEVEDAPTALTMPNKNYVNTLTLTSNADGSADASAIIGVYYLKDLSFTSDVILENITLIPMVEEKEDGKVVKDEEGNIRYEEVYAVSGCYPAPVNVKTGGNDLVIRGEVIFNTPVVLDGGKQGTLTIEEDALFLAYPNANVDRTKAEEGDEGTEGIFSEIQGKISNFADVNINQKLIVDGWETYKGDDLGYNPCELNVTGLTLGDNADITVGNAAESGQNNVKVTSNFIMNGSYLKVYGNAEFKNVTLAGTNPYLEVTGQKFNITGLLTSAATEAEFVASIDQNLTSVLNVSGTAVLEDASENRITVMIMNDSIVLEETETIVDKAVELGGIAYYDDAGNAICYSNHLLKAKNVSETVFLANTACTKNHMGEYDATVNNPADGYFLKKVVENKVAYVDVHYSDEIVATLYKVETDNAKTFINHYSDLNEAIAAINALKDKTAEYRIELLKSVGKTVNDEVDSYGMTVPQQAKRVIFSGAKAGIELFINTKMEQKTNLAFDNITVENTGLWNSKAFELIIDGTTVTVSGKTTIDNLVLANGATLTTEDATVITDIVNKVTLENKQNKIACTKAGGLTIKGSVIEPSENAAVPKVILDGAAEAFEADITTYKLTANEKLVTLEKEDMNSFIFCNNGSDVTGQAVWAGKSIYLVDADYSNDVIVEKYDRVELENGEYVYDMDHSTTTTKCLDFAEAANYINTESDKTAKYELIINGSIEDTKVTDKDETSTWTLPNKDKSAEILVDGSGYEIQFTKDLKVNGIVHFENLTMDNESFSISADKNSDVKEGKTVISQGESVIAFENVTVEGLKNIKGKKGATKVFAVNNTRFDLSGGITDVAVFTLTDTNVTTSAKSNVEVFTLEGRSSWDAKAITTIGDVYIANEATGTEGAATYVSTYYPKDKKGNTTEIPQLTITGKVNGGKLPVKIYDMEGNKIEIDNDNKIIMAKTEAADKFIAYPYVKITEDNNDMDANPVYSFDFKDGIQAYKDKNGYVYNRNLADAEVILGQLDKAGNWNESYVSTYAEAIDIINNAGDKTADYKIEIQTDLNFSKALTLPKAGKVKSLTISSIDRDLSEENSNFCTLSYTGAIQANCDVRFENVNLHETDKNGTVSEITVKPGNFDICFGDGVYTVRKDDYAVKEAQEGIIEEPNLVFKTIDGSKGGVDFGNNHAYVAGAIKLARVLVSDNAYVTGKGVISVTDICKAENEVSQGDNGGNSELNLTTYFTNKDFDKKSTQFTVSGDIDSEVTLNVRPMIYAKEYRPMTRGELMVMPEETPKAYQKVITAPKMTVSDHINVLWGELLPEEESFRYEWRDTDCSAVKYEGGIYFTDENAIGVEVVGYESVLVTPDENEEPQLPEEGVSGEMFERVEHYRASFFTWEQAVKEIEKLNHKDWSYDIRILKDQGAETPLKTVAMPSKAESVFIFGTRDNNDMGILTTNNKITIKCPTTFDNISVCAVKKDRDNYYSIPLTLDCGKLPMKLVNMNSGCGYDFMGWFNSEIKLSGSAGSSVEVRRMDTEPHCGFITQITNVDTVRLNAVTNYSSGAMEIVHSNYDIKDGIKGVKNLEILEGVEVNASKSEVSVTNLTIGESTGEAEVNENGEEIVHENGRKSQRRNDYSSRLQAKNITVSETTTMASADLKAGTTAVGDGMITLNNVVFKDQHNHIEGKQDANGNSLITIKGTAENRDWNRDWSAATISLCLRNSSQRYAKLTEGMHMLTAPKAAASIFRPNYDWRDEKTGEYHSNMGPEIVGEIYEVGPDGKVVMVDGNGNVVTEGEGGTPKVAYKPALYGLYNSGNNIVYGHLRNIENNEEVPVNEVRLYIGSSNLDKTGNVPSMEFATFEEAVKTIDSLAKYKEGTKEFEEYTIEVMRDVNIGNDKGDGKYSALTLPSKASELTIRGWGTTIRFSGNVTLKGNTTFESINLLPMKTVKGAEGGAEPTTMNMAAGNYTLRMCHGANVGYWTDEDYYKECLNNITGSVKGRLVIGEYEGLTANSISGVAIEFAGNGEGYAMNDNGTENTEDDWKVHSVLTVNGSITTKELKFADYAAANLRTLGKTTIDAVYVEGETIPVMETVEGNLIQIKGATQVMADKSKITDSVFFKPVIKEMENEEPQVLSTEKVILSVMSATGQDVPAGTKVVTGKYLDASDWYGNSFWITEEGGGGNDRIIYQNGADLYLGSVLPNNGESQ